jgi:hypothetical protein
VSETTSDIRTADRIVANPQQEIRLPSAGHTAGTIIRPRSPNRIHHRGSNPSRRPPISEKAQ